MDANQPRRAFAPGADRVLHFAAARQALAGPSAPLPDPFGASGGAQGHVVDDAAAVRRYVVARQAATALTAPLAAAAAERERSRSYPARAPRRTERRNSDMVGAGASAVEDPTYNQRQPLSPYRDSYQPDYESKKITFRKVPQSDGDRLGAATIMCAYAMLWNELVCTSSIDGKPTVDDLTYVLWHDAACAAKDRPRHENKSEDDKMMSTFRTLVRRLIDSQRKDDNKRRHNNGNSEGGDEEKKSPAVDDGIITQEVLYALLDLFGGVEGVVRRMYDSFVDSKTGEFVRWFHGKRQGRDCRSELSRAGPKAFLVTAAKNPKDAHKFIVYCSDGVAYLILAKKEGGSFKTTAHKAKAKTKTTDVPDQPDLQAALGALHDVDVLSLDAAVVCDYFTTTSDGHNSSSDENDAPDQPNLPKATTGPNNTDDGGLAKSLRASGVTASTSVAQEE